MAVAESKTDGYSYPSRFWLVVFILNNVAVIAAAITGHLSLLSILFLLSIIFFAILAWNYLAPMNRFFTFMKETTSKIVVRGDAFEKGLIQWRGWTLDSEWNVVREGTIDPRTGRILREPWHPFGGLRYYGLWPLLDIRVYKLRWKGLKLTEGKKQEIKFYDEWLDHILLSPDVYPVSVSEAETMYGEERIKVDAEFLVTMRVINPYKVLYRAPLNWIETLTSRLEALFRGFIANVTFDELIGLRGNSERLWAEWGNSDLIQRVFKNEWGVQIDENGIELRDVTPEKRIQDALVSRREQELLAQGRLAKTVNVAFNSMAATYGLTAGEFREKLRRSPKLRKELSANANDLYVRQLAIEGNSFLDIRTGGGGSPGNPILDAIGAFIRLPKGGGVNVGSGGGKKKVGKSKGAGGKTERQEYEEEGEED
ncbi:MAG: hypothetical protein COX90_00855 [Candidatus Nealsonbacteria bacterium CG_4_10_14_0_2_um_filter_38_17]|uniref:Band 7 domain-containing protein n=1 Tax=Candidatus Nealsonbacteria bacterium CG_4_10_14_0_2_um_filter_38_17 TaxID=1974680 RepID=A0A2M7UYV1_9BACT|nr:MAG: hypothetical protein COX90_00855 [Candidatus Nealsonbacteria bacterium CG_4_10_14_0_2_um_filter_38_17]